MKNESDFFKLLQPYRVMDAQEDFLKLFESKEVLSILYSPPELTCGNVRGVRFDNVSFSKTRLSDSTFSNCVFTDCLFIGTFFDEVEFHGCKFVNCNFFKCRFLAIYGKPEQFHDAIVCRDHANIAVHLYQQLRNVYFRSSQSEYRHGADYHFFKWRRILNFNDARRKGGWSLALHLPSHMISYLYGVLFGYGSRLDRVFVTTCFAFGMLLCMNYYCTSYMFSTPVEPSLVRTVYFTVTTMATVGAAGYTPNTDTGYFFVIVNVMFGITILSAVVGALLKKVVR